MNCPIHGVEFKVIPAGVSKKTGRPYPAFEACPFTDCREKPTAPLVASDPLDMKILEQKEGEAVDRDARRSYRIERQHSQEMALRYITIKGKTDFKWTELVEVIDKFMEDLERE